LKQLRQAIKDELGIKDKVSLKLYLPPKSEDDKKKNDLEEVKEGDDVLDQLIGSTEQVLNDDKISIRESGILEHPAGDLHVEIVIKVSIDVQGKGKDYSAVLEISPDAHLLSTLNSRLSFFKTFHQQRRMQLFYLPAAEDAVPVLIDDLQKTFREWDLKEDGVQLQLREPAKKSSY
jgi:hypothetical protein